MIRIASIRVYGIRPHTLFVSSSLCALCNSARNFPRIMNSSATVMSGDCFTFEVEWLDPSSHLQKPLRLCYYPDDQAVELYDHKAHKSFLKRTTYPALQLTDLVVGQVVTVFSRQLHIRDYGDEWTKKQISQVLERVLLLVAPDSLGRLGKLVEHLYTSQFGVEQVRMFAVTAREKHVCQSVTGWADGQLACAIKVSKTGCLNEIQSFRENIKKNMGIQLYTSTSKMGANQELEHFFPAESTSGSLKRTAKIQGTTLCLIKPHIIQNAHQTGAPGKIIDDILAAGFAITDVQMFHLDRTHAEEFYEVYQTVVPEYHGMVEELTSGRCMALEISPGPGMKFDTSKPSNDPTNNVVSAFRYLCGPMDVTMAKQVRPDSLRAKYGVSKLENAVHCTDLTEDGTLEVQYFFQILA